MSFILNALKKSEEERQTVQSDPVQDRIPDREDAIKKKRPLWLIILSLANLCLLFYFIWLFLLKDEPDTSKEKTPHITEKLNEIVENKKVVTQAAVQVAKVKKIVKPVREQVKPKVPLSWKDEVVKPIKTNKQHVVNKTKVEKSPKQRKENQFSISQRIETKRNETNKRKQTAFRSRTVDKQQTVKKENSPFAKRTYVPPSTTDYVETVEQNGSNPPYLSGMSYEFRRKVPHIQINVFVYSEKEEDRMVMIEMRKYQTGMEIAKNMTLKEIRKNSIIVEYDGKVFQIKR
jgi:general secretion pathway protein B